MTKRSAGVRALSMLAVLLLALLACRSKEKKSTTITQGADGGYTVSGGAKLTGDPKVCAAFKACCRHPQMGLACSLTQTASNGDCAQALASIKKQISERGLTPPEGCE
jgi:hypothetical protein